MIATLTNNKKNPNKNTDERSNKLFFHCLLHCLLLVSRKLGPCADLCPFSIIACADKDVCLFNNPKIIINMLNK
jgi:hypothetical protein